VEAYAKPVYVCILEKRREEVAEGMLKATVSNVSIILSTSARVHGYNQLIF
jgi:hypothetical protein